MVFVLVENKALFGLVVLDLVLQTLSVIINI